MNTIEGSGGRERKRERTFLIGSETGFYTERAGEKEETSESREWERNKYIVEDQNQNGDSFCDSSILLQGKGIYL